ncbi:hypothetical protein K432DRAFT_273900, partial [Lepidopterella palustris CBS 459.81]
LCCAAESGHYDVVKFLLENKGNVEAEDQDVKTAMLLASKYGHEDVVKLLLEKVANTKTKEGTMKLLQVMRKGM